jgi:hypothetical protein
VRIQIKYLCLLMFMAIIIGLVIGCYVKRTIYVKKYQLNDKMVNVVNYDNNSISIIYNKNRALRYTMDDDEYYVECFSNNQPQLAVSCYFDGVGIKTLTKCITVDGKRYIVSYDSSGNIANKIEIKDPPEYNKQ